MPQIDNLDEELNVERNLLLHARMNSISGPDARQRVGEVLRLVALSEHAKDAVQELSGGMKRRLTLARGLMTTPSFSSSTNRPPASTRTYTSPSGASSTPCANGA